MKSILIVLLGFLSLGILKADPVEDSTKKKKAPDNWFNLDSQEDKMNGVSTEKAYKELLKKKKSKTVIVAVIDSGIETEHEDLKDKIWINTKEIAGNGKDDDKNGYVDDVHGWNFLGSKDGKNITMDSYELTREYVRLKKKFDGKTAADISQADKEEFTYFQKVEQDYQKKLEKTKGELNNPNIQFLQTRCEALANYLKKESFNLNDIRAIKDSDVTDPTVKEAKQIALQFASQFDMGEAYQYIKHLKTDLEYRLNPEFDPRNIVGDTYTDFKEKIYGNNDYEGPDADHGTHVAGIIAANRQNALGMLGVAQDVKIMVVRAVPDGDERDKDVANAIRYAVDNGAKIINMSFGKDYSPQKYLVDEAVQYAASKGVLLVHAAGNDSKNLEEAPNFPNRVFSNNTQAPNWIEVGASSWKAEEPIGTFSNYGKTRVDVFAPGVDIYSSVPDQKYADHSGTSMAAPVVSGVAALVLSYYPNLSPSQLREIIMKSAIKYTQAVNKPGSEETISMNELCVTGGVVNAYEALKLAEQMSKKGK